MIDVTHDRNHKPQIANRCWWSGCLFCRRRRSLLDGLLGRRCGSKLLLLLDGHGTAEEVARPFFHLCIGRLANHWSKQHSRIGELPELHEGLGKHRREIVIGGLEPPRRVRDVPSRRRSSSAAKAASQAQRGPAVDPATLSVGLRAVQWPLRSVPRVLKGGFRRRAVLSEGFERHQSIPTVTPFAERVVREQP